MSSWSVTLQTVGLLVASNLFMTFAWYGHLKHQSNAHWLVAALVSWGIALFEYLLQVPANRIGYAGGWSAGQLKIAQEAIALTVFGLFMVFVLGEAVSWRHLAAFACILAAAAFLFVGR